MLGGRYHIESPCQNLIDSIDIAATHKLARYVTAPSMALAMRIPSTALDVVQRRRTTNLENLFRIRPAGVVSKKLIGALKTACAMRSCSLREACGTFIPRISISGPSR